MQKILRIYKFLVKNILRPSGVRARRRLIRVLGWDFRGGYKNSLACFLLVPPAPWGVLGGVSTTKAPPGGPRPGTYY